MKRISILHPSWKRPELARKCYDTWMGNAERPEEIEYILCLSEKDMTMGQYSAQFAGSYAHVITVPNNGLIVQVNAAAERSTGNLIVAVSDDFVCPKGWDTILLTALEGKSDYVVKTQDGIQDFIITLPIMDRAFYNRFGYIYHPVYNHMYGDEELAEVGKMLNRTITLPDYFRHEHYSTGINPKDEVNVKNDSYLLVDREHFKTRQKNHFDIVLLSILIPTLPERRHLLDDLVKELEKQTGTLPVEILTDPRDRRISTGEKRNALLARARGEYVCFFDDDDKPADHYIYSILSALRENPDCCNLYGIMTTNNANPVRFVHSIKYREYFEEDGVLYRPPNHLNVIRRSIARHFKFPEIVFGEDTAWAMQLCQSGMLRTEAHIDETLYFYRYDSRK